MINPIVQRDRTVGTDENISYFKSCCLSFPQSVVSRFAGSTAYETFVHSNGDTPPSYISKMRLEGAAGDGHCEIGISGIYERVEKRVNDVLAIRGPGEVPGESAIFNFYVLDVVRFRKRENAKFRGYCESRKNEVFCHPARKRGPFPFSDDM